MKYNIANDIVIQYDQEIFENDLPLFFLIL